jgi:AbrB family looped-hinge helix DNA binding protein
MKATGVVRRIDDLGRVVIPKEIRKTLRIKEGDPSLPSLEVLYKIEINLRILIYQYEKSKLMNT